MFKDLEGLDLVILGQGVIGEVMLILFVSVVVTTSVNIQLLHNEALGSSKGENAPVIGLEVTVGPGRSIIAAGERVDLEKMLKLAAAVAEEEKIQVQMHMSGDPELFWELRYELKKLGRGFVEAPPIGGAADRRERG